MVARLRKHVWTVVGSVVIAAGSTLAGLAAFDGRIPVVMVGFLIFIVGYSISQFGTYASQNAFLRRPLFSSVIGLGWQGTLRILLLTVGWAGIALGVTLFSQTILHPGLSNAVLSGVTSITGYMAAHVGINGVGLGGSVFGPVLTRLQGPPDHGGRNDD